MAAKIFKILWIVSLLTIMGVLVYSYASWPESVYLDDANPPLAIGKSVLFYLMIGLIGLFNMLAFIFPKLNFGNRWMAWYYGMLVSLHIFLVSGIILITIFNSAENYNYSYLGPLMYGSLALLAVWIVAGPILAFAGKKQLPS